MNTYLSGWICELLFVYICNIPKKSWKEFVREQEEYRL
jgi:hypothetical protein